ncbi:transposable element Tcb2 transposase [Trichonephila clavipes]|nr:transposable element Tcb2 transposase [Trichonephila clavipes]
MQRDCALRIDSRQRLTSLSVEYKTGNQSLFECAESFTKHDFLQSHVFPLMQWLPGAICQQDNARPHTARVSQDCLRTVTTIRWPARSPYVSPIEHIWDHLGRQIGPPTSLKEL